METPTDDYLQKFRDRSDQAFLAMQASADAAMTQFLQSYGEGTAMTAFQTPDMAWGRATVSAIPGIMRPASARRSRPAAEKARESQRAAGRKLKTPEIMNVGELGEGLRQEFNEQVEQMASEGKGFLRSLTTDLGERAKREAAALAEAARQAIQEETSLRGLKERARAELEEAKKRVAAEIVDARSDAMEDLGGMAKQRLGAIGHEAMEAAEEAGFSAQKKLDDILLS